MIILRIISSIEKCTQYFVKGIFEKKPIVSYVGGWLGHKNLGDEILFKALKHLFNRFDFLHFDGSKTISTLLQSFPYIKGGILAGGTLINRNESWLKIAKKFCEINDKFYIFGSGVANPFFWSNNNFWENLFDQWKPILEKSSFVGVRGPLSAELLDDIGIKNVEVVGDPVIAFAENEIFMSYQQNSIGLNIGQSNGNVWGNEEKILYEFIKLANFAKKAKWEVKWFVVCPDDLKITLKAAKSSNTLSNIYTIYNNHCEYIELVKSVSVFVGMKLHATILATCSFVPSIMLEYRPKCLDYMKSINQEESNIRTDKFEAANVWDMVQFWNQKRNVKSEELFKAINVLKEKQQKKANDLMSRI